MQQKPKPIWVFVAGTYRSGSTTHYEMTRDIVEKTMSGIGIGYHNERRLRDFDALEFNDLKEVHRVYDEHEIEYRYNGLPKFSRHHHYIVCKVFEYLPNGFRGDTSHGEILHKQNRIRAIVSTRDPRDIITSMRERAKENKGNDAGRTFEFNKTATVDFPAWLGNVIKWADLGPRVSLVSPFESFTVHREGEVRRIARHLEIPITDRLAKSIADSYSPEAMAERKRKYFDKKNEINDLREDAALPSIPALKFATSGHWRNHLTPEEADLVYYSNGAFFERFGYGK